MKKRLCSVLLVLAMVAAMLAGCSGANEAPAAESAAPAATEAAPAEAEAAPAESEAAPAEPSGEPVTLRIAWWGADARHEATLANLDAYTAANPNVTFEPEYGAYGGFLDKLYVQLASKTVPDIPAIDGKWVMDMMRNYRDSFVNLKELPIDLSGFDPKFLEVVCGDAEFTLGASMGTNAYGVIYNPAFFEKFGLGDPENWGWEDIMAAGVKVQEQDPESHLMYNILNNYGYLFKWYIKQMNGKDIVAEDLTLTFTREEAVKAWDYILRLVETGTVPTFEESMPYATSYPHEVPKWLEQKYGMHMTQASNLSAQVEGSPFELKTANLPVLEGAVDVGWPVSSSQVLGVYAYGENIDAAAAFLDWYVNDEEAVRVTGDTRGIPSNQNAMNLLVAENKLMSQMLEFTDRYNAQGNSVENSVTINAAILELTCEFAQQVAYKQMTPEEAADAYMDELSKVVQTMA